mgnify:FL=1
MKKGDLVRISIAVVELEDESRKLTKKDDWFRAIVVEDYTGNKMVKVFVPTTGETRKYHVSMVQMHKRIKENY